MGTLSAAEGAIGTLSEALPEEPIEKLGRELCGDEGYFAIGQMAQLHECGVRTVIADPQAQRRKPQKASAEHRAALNYAGRSTRSASGRAQPFDRLRALSLSKGCAREANMWSAAFAMCSTTEG